jgi:hypothetical protein
VKQILVLQTGECVKLAEPISLIASSAMNRGELESSPLEYDQEEGIQLPQMTEKTLNIQTTLLLLVLLLFYKICRQEYPFLMGQVALSILQFITADTLTWSVT